MEEEDNQWFEQPEEEYSYLTKEYYSSTCEPITHEEIQLLSSLQKELEPDPEEITPSEQTLYKDKEELKQLLSEILHQIYLDGKMEKFNEEFYVYSAYSLIVLVAQIIWERLQTKTNHHLSMELIFEALNLVPPRVSQEGQDQLDRDNRTLRRSYY